MQCITLFWILTVFRTLAAPTPPLIHSLPAFGTSPPVASLVLKSAHIVHEVKAVPQIAGFSTRTAPKLVSDESAPMIRSASSPSLRSQMNDPSPGQMRHSLSDPSLVESFKKPEEPERDSDFVENLALDVYDELVSRVLEGEGEEGILNAIPEASLESPETEMHQEFEPDLERPSAGPRRGSRRQRQAGTSSDSKTFSS